MVYYTVLLKALRMNRKFGKPEQTPGGSSDAIRQTGYFPAWDGPPLGPRGAPPRPRRCWDPLVLAALSGGRCRGGRAVEEEEEKKGRARRGEVHGRQQQTRATCSNGSKLGNK